uniref:RING-type domain-containing protein n=1 Tax=Graphocephala atropunctata TaxID=36148 RepID=A0A1B6KWV6_9HEMI
MSNFYYELDLESILQCPVCFELPANIIYLCRVGHHMCERCRRRLTNCPTCQSAMTGARNFLAEALISKFSMFKGSGDGPLNNNMVSNSEGQPDSSTPAPAELQDNPDQLPALPLAAGEYRCLLESCRNRKPLPNAHLFKHIQTIHAHLFDKFQNKTATFSHNFENFYLNRGKRKYHRAFHVSNMGIFFLNLELLEDSYLNCWITSPLPYFKVKRFQYQIHFIKEEDDVKVTFLSQVGSNLKELDWLLKRGQVMIIPPTTHNLTPGEFFSLEIKIVYTSASSSSGSSVLII